AVVRIRSGGRSDDAELASAIPHVSRRTLLRPRESTAGGSPRCGDPWPEDADAGREADRIAFATREPDPRTTPSHGPRRPGRRATSREALRGLDSGASGLRRAGGGARRSCRGSDDPRRTPEELPPLGLHPVHLDRRGRNPDRGRPRFDLTRGGWLVSAPGRARSARPDRGTVRRRHTRDDSPDAPRRNAELLLDQETPHAGPPALRPPGARPERIFQGVQSRPPRGRGGGPPSAREELRLDQQPRSMCSLARNLRRPPPGPQEERDRHEGRLHAPRRSVLRIPDRLVRRAPPGGRRGSEQRLVTDW